MTLYYDLGYTLIYLHNILYIDFMCTRIINRCIAYGSNFKRINIYSSFETAGDA